MPRSYLVKKEGYHYMWSKNHKPVLEIDPGDHVTFQIHEVTSSQITRKSTTSDIANLDVSKFYPLAGSVRVAGARKGDALAVSILKVDTADWVGPRSSLAWERLRSSTSPSCGRGSSARKTG
ncbi:MAG: acetamidase/formamidase family protein [Candidatus Bathyarchaeia archaeon]